MDEKLYLIDLDCYARAEENQKKKVKESHCFDFGLLPTKGLGCSTGIPLNWFLHTRLLTRYFGTPWTFPVTLLGIAVVFGIASAIAAVYVPAKRVRSMKITEAINEL